MGLTDILARSEVPKLPRPFDADRVVRTLDITVAHPHPPASVDVEPVTVPHLHIANDPRAVDHHILAAREPDRPEWRVVERGIPENDVVASDEEKQEGPLVDDVVGSTDVGAGVFPAGAVDEAAAGDGDVRRAAMSGDEGPSFDGVEVGG